jgi:hypothetical protein
MVTLKIDIEGATEAEIARGLQAAQAVFDRAGVTPWQAAEAASAAEAVAEFGSLCFEGESEPACTPLTAREQKLAALWDKADRTAVGACCIGWADPPPTAGLELEYDEQVGNFSIWLTYDNPSVKSMPTRMPGRTFDQAVAKADEMLANSSNARGYIIAEAERGTVRMRSLDRDQAFRERAMAAAKS